MARSSVPSGRSIPARRRGGTSAAVPLRGVVGDVHEEDDEAGERADAIPHRRREHIDAAPRAPEADEIRERDAPRDPRRRRDEALISDPSDRSAWLREK